VANQLIDEGTLKNTDEARAKFIWNYKSVVRDKINHKSVARDKINQNQSRAQLQKQMHSDV
jgi:hypothetical protein